MYTGIIGNMVLNQKQPASRPALQQHFRNNLRPLGVGMDLTNITDIVDSAYQSTSLSILILILE